MRVRAHEGVCVRVPEKTEQTLVSFHCVCVRASVRVCLRASALSQVKLFLGQ